MIYIISFDVIVDYYTSSGCLDVQPDEEGYINIDQDENCELHSQGSQERRNGAL